MNLNLICSEKWQDILKTEFDKKYFKDLISFLNSEYQNHKIFPQKKQVFEALNSVAFNDVKVIIIGQDPYHGKNQANGIAFSVDDKIKKPPSLKNILKELSNDLNVKTDNVNLKNWANQGVLMLNSILTVRENSPSSHKNQGWEIFTTKIIKELAIRKHNLVFILWGKYAEEKIKNINVKNHFILKSSHPSPLSSYRGFFGCKHFTKTNKILRELKKEEILWV
tara:strand:+ start:1646 stop:2314 length:669 start_codon:yes stop_codon:yes gene_type:complete